MLELRIVCVQVVLDTRKFSPNIVEETKLLFKHLLGQFRRVDNMLLTLVDLVSDVFQGLAVLSVTVDFLVLRVKVGMSKRSKQNVELPFNLKFWVMHW